MRYYNILFCWTIKTPFILVYDGIENTVSTNSFTCRALDEKDVINKLRGTDTKIISMINGIKCLQ